MKTVNPRWAKIQALFNQAADMPLAERTAFLDKECGNDQELRHELEQLLSLDAGPPSDVQSGIQASLLTQSLSSASEGLTRDRRNELVGTIVGAYRLTAVLGHGGAGTVYLGERSDRQYSAQVAVKIVDNTLSHDEIIRRFHSERQILANLNHPHIARLLDAGETHAGQPYLVMEYVHGEPIDRYCNERTLPNKERIELFIRVCEAVQYAHQNLIVHRDLKPGNILVTPDGTPKLLDFGIAKLADASARAAADMALTRMNDRLLTPEYASPEQILGHHVTTTSDVYALGIVLYELLTGNRPYQVNAVSQLELERTICILDPPKPSQMINLIASGDPSRKSLDEVATDRHTSPKRLISDLEGDLDAIILRALRKEPSQRYASVDQFVDDLKRHLSNQPVIARQGNWLYYSKRFVRRHSLGVAMSALAITGLITVAIVLSIQTKRIAEQRDLAKQESERAESVSNFMLEVFKNADPFENQGKQVTAKELLDKAGIRISEDLSTQPEVKARLMAAIGSAYLGQGQPDVAIKYLEDSVRIFSDRGASVEITAKTLGSLANALRELGQLNESEQALLRAQSALEHANLEATGTYIQLLTDHGRLKLYQGNAQESETILSKALQHAIKKYGRSDPETGAIQISISQAYLWQGNIPSALSAAKEGSAIYHAALPELHPDRVMADYVLGELLYRNGQSDQANLILQKVLKDQKAIYGENSSALVSTLDTLSLVQRAKGKLDEAEISSREALMITQLNSKNDTIIVAYYRTALSELLLQRSKLSEAETEVLAALKILQTPENINHQYTASAEYLWAQLLIATSRPKQAIQVLQNNILHWQRTQAPAWRAARSQSLLGELMWQQHVSGYESLLKESYAILSAANSGASKEDINIARTRLIKAGIRIAP